MDSFSHPAGGRCDL